MTIKTEKKVESVETVKSFAECDLDPCFRTDKGTEVFELPITPTDDDTEGRLHICAECLTTLYGSDDFDYIGSIEEQKWGGGIKIEAVEEKNVPKSVALTIALVPLFAVFLFNALILLFYTPGWFGWGFMALFSAMLYAGTAQAQAEDSIEGV